MEREDIERRDFPVGRRGYEQAAVDAHLRGVADEIERLRENSPPPARPAASLSAGTSEQVRLILEAAERGAADMREDAGRQAKADTGDASVTAEVGIGPEGESFGLTVTLRVELPEELQGEISGLSRSVSNLGSSFGTAIAGTILVSAIATGTRSYVVAMIVLVGFGLFGLFAALRLPRHAGPPGTPTT